MEKTQVGNFSLQQLTLMLLTVLVIYFAFQILQPFFSVIAWAVSLGVVTYPVFTFLSKRGASPSASSGLTVLLVALIILGPLSLVTAQLVMEVSESVEQSNPAPEALIREAEKNPQTKQILGKLKQYGNFDFRGGIKDITTKIAGSVPSILSGSLWSVAQFFMILFSLFYFYRDQKTMLQTTRSLLPLKDSDVDEVFQRVNETIHATVFGSLLIAAIQGSLGGLMFWFLGLPSPLLWTVVMAILAVIPNLGAFVVWGPVAVYFMIQGDWVNAGILIGWGAVAIGLIDNVLYPWFVGNKLRFHPLAIFFFMLGGVALFGASGIILGPIILAVTDALIHIWKKKF